MPSINDRIGSQNVIRVLSNASSPPTKLIDLTDVDSTSKATDGLLLIWDVATEKFVMNNVVDQQLRITNNTSSNSTTSGALIVTGGVGIGQNLHVAGNGDITGTLTVGTDSVLINGDTNVITVGSGVTISSTDGITSPSIEISGPLNAESLYISGITTLAALSGVTTTGGDFYSGQDVFVGRNLKVEGTSEFIGQATFRGGTINLGDQNTDDINVVGEFISNLVPDVDNTNDLGTQTQRWRNVYVAGLTTTNTLHVSGLSTFKDNVSVTGFVTVTEGIYYDDEYTGPNGIAYFDNTGKLIGAAATATAQTVTNFVLTTNNSGIPVWSSVIDGGEF